MGIVITFVAISEAIKRANALFRCASLHHSGVIHDPNHW